MCVGAVLVERQSHDSQCGTNNSGGGVSRGAQEGLWTRPSQGVQRRIPWYRLFCWFVHTVCSHLVYTVIRHGHRSLLRDAVLQGLVNPPGLCKAQLLRSCGALYSDTLCTNDEVSRYQFNCDQRTHHNYLELLPLYLVLMVRDNAASTQRSISN